MSKNGTSANGVANPARIDAFDPDDDEIIRVVIETPKGSRNKYAFDAEEKAFTLKAVLPAGMAFPYDFGFVPSTEAEDGDPIDVLILMDEPAFPGCLVKCRTIGVIEGEQVNGKKPIRNDRIVAVDVENHQWEHIRRVDDLGRQFVKELEEFFVNYHKLSGREYQILGVKGPGAARKCIGHAVKAVKKA